MPILGYISGIQLEEFVSLVVPWIAFILLATIGLKMIYETLKDHNDNENKNNGKNKSSDSKNRFSFKELTLLGDSIDYFRCKNTLRWSRGSLIMKENLDLKQVESELLENNYISDENITSVTFLAIAFKKSILVEGPSGTGKTQLPNPLQTDLKEIFSEYNVMKE